MNKSLIATAGLFLLFLTTAHAQTQPRRSGQQLGDSTRRQMGRFRDMQPVSPGELPATLTASIQKTYPNAELRRTMKGKDGHYYVMLVDASKTRKLLVANSNGEVIETRDMPANRGGRRGGGQPDSN